jgi:hypothetical protein
LNEFVESTIFGEKNIECKLILCMGNSLPKICALFHSIFFNIGMWLKKILYPSIINIDSMAVVKLAGIGESLTDIFMVASGTLVHQASPSF